MNIDQASERESENIAFQSSSCQRNGWHGTYCHILIWTLESSNEIAGKPDVLNHSKKNEKKKKQSMKTCYSSVQTSHTSVKTAG